MQCTAELLRRRWYGDATTLILPGLLRRLQARRNLSRAGIVEPAAPSHFLNLKGDDSRGSPQDYKPQLARLAQSLDNVAERLHGVEQSPILQRDAEYYTAVLERGGEGLIRSAARELERQASNLERAGRDLAAHTRSAYEREAQDFRMWTAGGVGVLAGIFLILLLPRFLPFSADSHIASLVMGRDRVSAGYAMIEAVAPFEVEKMRWGGRFYDSSAGEVSACLETAKKTGKDQRCSIAVPAPAQ